MTGTRLTPGLRGRDLTPGETLTGNEPRLIGEGRTPVTPSFGFGFGGTWSAGGGGAAGPAGPAAAAVTNDALRGVPPQTEAEERLQEPLEIQQRRGRPAGPATAAFFGRLPVPGKRS